MVLIDTKTHQNKMRKVTEEHKPNEVSDTIPII